MYLGFHAYIWFAIQIEKYVLKKQKKYIMKDYSIDWIKKVHQKARMCTI